MKWVDVTNKKRFRIEKARTANDADLANRREAMTGNLQVEKHHWNIGAANDTNSTGVKQSLLKDISRVWKVWRQRTETFVVVRNWCDGIFRKGTSMVICRLFPWPFNELSAWDNVERLTLGQKIAIGGTQKPTSTYPRYALHRLSTFCLFVVISLRR